MSAAERGTWFPFACVHGSGFTYLAVRPALNRAGSSLALVPAEPRARWLLRRWSSRSRRGTAKAGTRRRRSGTGRPVATAPRSRRASPLWRRSREPSRFLAHRQPRSERALALKRATEPSRPLSGGMRTPYGQAQTRPHGGVAIPLRGMRTPILSRRSTQVSRHPSSRVLQQTSGSAADPGVSLQNS